MKMSNEYNDWLRDRLEEEKLNKDKIEAYIRLTNELINNWEKQGFYCKDIDVPEWITSISKEMIEKSNDDSLFFFLKPSGDIDILEEMIKNE